MALDGNRLALRLELKFLILAVLTMSLTVVESDGLKQAKINLKLGVLIPFNSLDSSMVNTAVNLALEEIKANQSLLPDYNITAEVVDTRCTVNSGVGVALRLFRQNVSAFIGPQCDSVCEVLGYLSREWNLPMISYGCESTILSNKLFYSTFSRTVGPVSQASVLYGNTLRYFNWNRAAVLASSDRTWQLTANSIIQVFYRFKFQVASNRGFEPISSYYYSRQTLYNIMADVQRRTRSK